jgi:hypothetical protein
VNGVITYDWKINNGIKHVAELLELKEVKASEESYFSGILKVNKFSHTTVFLPKVKEYIDVVLLSFLQSETEEVVEKDQISVVPKIYECFGVLLFHYPYEERFAVLRAVDEVDEAVKDGRLPFNAELEKPLPNVKVYFSYYCPMTSIPISNLRSVLVFRRKDSFNNLSEEKRILVENTVRLVNAIYKALAERPMEIIKRYLSLMESPQEDFNFVYFPEYVKRFSVRWEYSLKRGNETIEYSDSFLIGTALQKLAEFTSKLEIK